MELKPRLAPALAPYRETQLKERPERFASHAGSFVEKALYYQRPTSPYLVLWSMSLDSLTSIQRARSTERSLKSRKPLPRIATCLSCFETSHTVFLTWLM